ALGRHVMKAIGGDCGDAAQAGDLDPRCLQRHRAVTYLAGVVAAPSPDRPVAPERQAVSLTARDCDDADYPRDIHWRMPHRRRPVTELAVDVFSPIPTYPVACRRQVVNGAG